MVVIVFDWLLELQMKIKYLTIGQKDMSIT